LPKFNEFPENLRCSNINGAMHILLVGERLTGAKLFIDTIVLMCWLNNIYRRLIIVI